MLSPVIHVLRIVQRTIPFDPLSYTLQHLEGQAHCNMLHSQILAGADVDSASLNEQFVHLHFPRGALGVRIRISGTGGGLYVFQDEVVIATNCLRYETTFAR
jgi:hypothetical protein